MQSAGRPGPSRPGTAGKGDVRRLACPFCGTYDVDRLFVGSTGVDACECTACGARWDEDPVSGAYRGRADRRSVLMPHER